MDTTHTSKALKCVQTSSTTSTHIHSRFLRRAQKAPPEPPRSKSIRCALMPFRRMRQFCRFRTVMVWLIFNISASSWRNKTVQGRLNSHHNIYSPWTQVHRSLAPSSAPRWNAFGVQSTSDACWKSVKFDALISECLDKKKCFHPTFLVMHYTAPNQNKCKILQQIPNHPHLYSISFTLFLIFKASCLR